MNENFDIFISYNWESKDKVRKVHAKLKNDYKYKVWIDFEELDSRVLYDQLVDGIKKAKIVLCFITKKYTESDNCKREITFASDIKKPLLIVMLERCSINDLGSVGFIIAPLTRINFYHDENIYNSWSGPIFDSFIKSIENNLGENVYKIKIIEKEKEKPTTKTKTIKAHEEKNKLAIELNRKLSVDKIDKNYTKALETIDKAIKLEPTNIQYLISKSEILNLAQKYEESIVTIDSVLRLEPNNQDAKEKKAYALNELANIEFNAKDFLSALNKYDESIKLCPDNKIYYLNKSVVLKSIKKYDDAVASLDIALKIDPNFDVAIQKKALILNEYGLELFNKENYEKALIIYNKAIECNPNEAIYYCNKADCLTKLKIYTDGLECYDLALKIEPKFEYAAHKKSFVLNYLAIEDTNIGKYDEALKKFNKAIELNSNEKSFYYYKAGVLNNLKKYKESIECINLALEIDAEYELALQRKAQTLNYFAIHLNQNENYKKALKMYDLAISLNPYDKVLYLNKASTLNCLNMFDEANEMLNKALEIDPDFKQAKEKKAYCLNAQANNDFNKGKLIESVTKYNKAIELNSNEKSFYSNKAAALINMKKFNEAIDCLNIALKIDPKYSTAINKKAMVLNSLAVIDDKSGSYESALIKYKKAIELNPNQKVFYVNIADTYLTLKKYNEAAQMADVALRIDPDYEKAKEIKLLAISKLIWNK